MVQFVAFLPTPVASCRSKAFMYPVVQERHCAIRNGTVRQNTSFAQVVRACSHRRETWIDETIVQSYIGLHQAGHAHSLEIWRQGMLVGGLYGVVIGGAFFGESMFHHVAGASKVALVTLVARLKEAGFQLLDTQWTTPHLVQFGAVSIPRREYLHRLQLAIRATPNSLW